MKTNEELLREFERRCNMSLEEFKEEVRRTALYGADEFDKEEEIPEVDDVYEYMKSLGYSTLAEIKEKYHL